MAGRLARSVRAADVTGRVKHATQTLRDEFQAGKRGDEGPAQPIWASPKEQLDAVLGLLRGAAQASATAATATTEAMTDMATVQATETDVQATETEADGGSGVAEPQGPASGVVDLDDMLASDADEVAAALRNVDWATVKSAAAERTGDAARTVKAMADQVDWSRVQPVAAQVSSALIAAVASGQLGVGGRLGSTVARAIVDQGGLGQQVAKRVNARQLPVPADLRRIIDATARES